MKWDTFNAVWRGTTATNGGEWLRLIKVKLRVFSFTSRHNRSTSYELRPWSEDRSDGFSELVNDVLGGFEVQAWALGGCCVHTAGDALILLFPPVPGHPDGEVAQAQTYEHWNPRSKRQVSALENTVTYMIAVYKVCFQTQVAALPGGAILLAEECGRRILEEFESKHRPREPSLSVHGGVARGGLTVGPCTCTRSIPC